MSTDAQFQNAGLALSVRGLSKRYSIRDNGRWQRSFVHAATDVTFEVPSAKTLALIGSSGSGKSTVARCITRLENPDAGEIRLGDTNLARLSNAELRRFRPEIQMIFQDPVTSMNLRMSAAQVLEEPLLIQKRCHRNQRREQAAMLMKEVGISPDWLDRRVTEFSGGQRQRLAIARALILRPKCLVLDEALTGLDLVTQAEIADLLLNLQAEQSLTYLLISHDLSLVRRMAEYVAIMSHGKIVEQGLANEIMTNPSQPEAKLLVAAAERFRAAFFHAQGASV